jgi:hypothetical protein
MSYKPRSLFSLIEDINDRLFLPHIQRPFVWEEEQMLRLFDSLMRNYPIQTLLFWRTTEEIKARRFMDQVDWEVDLSDYYEKNVTRAGHEKVFVLDGQQRIQSLFAMFSGATTLADGERGEAFLDVTSGGEVNDAGLRYRLQFSSKSPGLPWYRLASLLGGDAARNADEIAEGLNDALDAADQSNVLNVGETDCKDRQRRVRRNLSQLTSLLREEKYFWVQQLDGVADRQYSYRTVLDIFVRVNSGGTKLDASDLMFAAMKEGWDDIEQAIEDTTELLNGTNLQFDKTFPLKCLLIVNGAGAETSPEKFSGDEGRKLLEVMQSEWDRAELAFQELRDFLKNDLKVYADKVIRSYNSFIPIFDYLYFNPKPNERSKALLRGYYYKAQLFGWYSQSTDTIINGLHSVVGKNCPAGFPMADIKTYFEGRGNASRLTRSHIDVARLRFLVLNLVYVDKMGGSPFDVKFKGNEPHVDHIYPRHGLLTKLGLSSTEINSIGNYRFVGATDNIRKRAELPASYFGRLRAAGVPIEKHLLLRKFATDPSALTFDVETYRHFRDQRADTIWEICDRTVNPELFAAGHGAST